MHSTLTLVYAESEHPSNFIQTPFLLLSGDVVETHPLFLRSFIGLLCQHWMMMVMIVEQLVETEVLGENLP
jgi:hypothetical protein